MRDSERWFTWLAILGPLHVLEQVFLEPKSVMVTYCGTVALVVATVGLIQLMLLGGLSTGRWQLVPVGLFGVMGFGEIHHIVQAIGAWGYVPGTATAIPFATLGVLVLRAVAREFRAAAPSSARLAES